MNDNWVDWGSWAGWMCNPPGLRGGDMPRVHRASRFRPALQSLEDRFVPSLAGVASPAVTSLVATWDGGATSLGRFAPGQTYQGLAGGFYANEGNEPSAELAEAAAGAASRIVPLDVRGRPSANGKIGVVAIGQSTTEQWFSTFAGSARGRRGELRPGVTFINGGQSGKISTSWATDGSTWLELRRRVGSARLQVQVVFLDAALIYGQNIGGAEAQARVYSGQLSAIIARTKRLYPNLRMVYAFPYHWAGSAAPQKAVTEPSGYESQFGIRRVVLEQSLNEPVVVWGPDVWSQTKSPALYSDGVHWSGAGRAVMTDLTWRFLADDPSAARWLWRQG